METFGYSSVLCRHYKRFAHLLQVNSPMHTQLLYDLNLALLRWCVLLTAT